MLQSQSIGKLKELQGILSNKSGIVNVIGDMLKGFKVCKQLQKINKNKTKGFEAIDIISALLLIPFVLENSILGLIKSSVALFSEMQKDALYRLKNDTDINWRDLLYSIAGRFQSIVERSSVEPDEPCNDIISNVSCLIIDDTTLRKTGYKIEGIGKVFDHTLNSFVLGFKMLCCCFWDGKSLNPIDFSLHSERGKKKKKKNEFHPFGLTKKQLKGRYRKKRQKSTPGYRRKKELVKSKVTTMLEMIKRAVGKGFDPDYVLMDKWFISEQVIKFIRKIKKGSLHLISACKKDKRKYLYQGKSYTASEILKMNREKRKRCRAMNSFYIAVKVQYKGVPMILYFNKPTRRKHWELLVTTDTKLSFINAMKIYRIRWGIEVFFKESKQHLLLGKCQSQDFDAQIADITLSMIRYILLNLNKRFSAYETMGEAFTNTRIFTLELTIGQRLWTLFLEICRQILELFEMDEDLFMTKLFSIPEFEKAIYSLIDKSDFRQNDGLQNSKNFA